jgi:hypothetical protein
MSLTESNVLPGQGKTVPDCTPSAQNGAAKSLAAQASLMPGVCTNKNPLGGLNRDATGTGAGRMMMHMLGAFAEFERGIIRERSMTGQKAAMDRGVHCGRPRGLEPGTEADIVKLYESGFYTLHSLTMVFDAHPSTIKRAIYRIKKPGHSSLR